MTSHLLLTILLLTAPFHEAFAVDLSPINGFGTKLLRTAATHDGEGTTNRMTSPIAENLALGMAAHGAAGDTRERLLSDLGLPASLADAGRLHRQCQDHLVTMGNADNGEPTLTLSQAAWHRTGDPALAFSKDFTAQMRTVYSAEIGQLDFKDPSAAKTVNAWVDQRTKGLIKEIAKPTELRALDYLMLNVTYFEGSWASNFRPIEPGQYSRFDNSFTQADGTVVQVPMISAKDDFRVHENAEETIVELPIASPENVEYAVYAVLAKDPKAEPARYWNAPFWAATIAQMKTFEPGHGEVILPKFSFDYEVTLDQNSEVTAGLDLGYLFENSANFSALSPAGGKIGLIKEVTRIELDEKGVKAAAAVMVGGLTLSIGPQSDFSIRFDRPFAFAIVEKTSAAVLFLGEVQKPQP